MASDDIQCTIVHGLSSAVCSCNCPRPSKQKIHTVNSPIKAPLPIKAPPLFSEGCPDSNFHVFGCISWSDFHSVKKPLEAENVLYLSIFLLTCPAPLLENLQYMSILTSPCPPIPIYLLVCVMPIVRPSAAWDYLTALENCRY